MAVALSYKCNTQWLKLCDGENKTPDLKDRFVAGTGLEVSKKNQSDFEARLKSIENKDSITTSNK